MKTLLKSAILLAALMLSGPAFADDGSGRPVPGLGPGGAGATNAAPGDPGFESTAPHGSDAVALYRPGHTRRLIQRYGSAAGNRPAE